MLLIINKQNNLKYERMQKLKQIEEENEKFVFRLVKKQSCFKKMFREKAKSSTTKAINCKILSEMEGVEKKKYLQA